MDTIVLSGNRLPAFRLIALTGLLLLVIRADMVLAHGTIGSFVEAKTVCANFSYDDGEPMGYAKITVSAPDLEQPFQSGATDQNGKFCFIPDRSGSWLVTANDGMGHQHQLSTTFADSKSRPAAAPLPDTVVAGNSERFSRALAGIGIIFGITGMAGWYRARRRQHQHPQA